MKTKKNVQKTALISAAATGLAILSFTVNAQVSMKSLFENNGNKHIAMVMENTNNNSSASNTCSRSFTDAETFASYLETETEELLNVENWMVDENNFAISAELEAETERPLEIEDWMTNESAYNVYSALIETETEEELVREDWMTNESTFAKTQKENSVTKTSSKPISTSTYFYREVNTEEKLEVEGWMINPKIWGK